MTEIPLYGAVPGGYTDPYYYMRIIFASNRGSLMELGIQPIVTAGMIIQLLSGSGLIAVDRSNPEDRSLMSGVTKFFSIIMTTFIAIAYLVGGAYGSDLSLETSLIIFLQLLFAGDSPDPPRRASTKGVGLRKRYKPVHSRGCGSKNSVEHLFSSTVSSRGRSW